MTVMTPRKIFWAVALASGAVVALLLAPLADPGGWGAITVSRAAFRMLCHQDPARSLEIGGVVLPACARCAGLYLGFFAGWIGWRLMPPTLRDAPVSGWALLAGLAPLAIDGAQNALGLVTTPAGLRLATGLIFGAVAARALWPALAEALMTASELWRPPGRAPETRYMRCQWTDRCTRNRS